MPAARYETVDWYETPLYYDIVFEEDTALEGNFLEAMHELHGIGEGRRLLEPACGSGRLVAEMVRRGWQVTGFDLNRKMLDFARRRLREAGLKARILKASMEDFSFRGRFDLAHCLVSTFKYLLDEESARSHLACVARALRPGGLYVLGFHLSDYADRRCSRERWVGLRGDTKVVCNIQSWPADRRRRLERCRSRLVVEEPGRIRRQETNWWFRTYNAAQVRRLLRTVPDLEHVATYDFTYQLRRRRHRFDDRQLDNLLILRRRGR